MGGMEWWFGVPMGLYSLILFLCRCLALILVALVKKDMGTLLLVAFHAFTLLYTLLLVITEKSTRRQIITVIIWISHPDYILWFSYSI